MTVITYQSKLVLRILKSNETYRAKPNLSLRGEYDALIDMLGLKCECPIFGVLKGKKQNTGGKVSGSVRLTLDVPEEYVRLTEYSVWADFLYAYRFSNPSNYKSLRADCEELTVRRYNEILEDLRTQRKPSQYDTPQVVLEKISPQWLVKYHVVGKGEGFLRKLFHR